SSSISESDSSDASMASDSQMYPFSSNRRESAFYWWFGRGKSTQRTRRATTTRSSHASQALRSTRPGALLRALPDTLFGLRLWTALAGCPTLSGHRILGDHGLIELRHRALGQALPNLVHAQQRDAEIAAHGQRLAVRA